LIDRSNNKAPVHTTQSQLNVLSIILEVTYIDRWIQH